MKYTMYINGVPHRTTTVVDGSFCADSATEPGVPCTLHCMSTKAARELADGCTVRAHGCTYSLRPPMTRPWAPTRAAPCSRTPMHMTYIVRALIVVWCVAALYVYTR